MTSLTTLKSFSSADRTEVIAAEAASRPLGTNAYMNTHTRTRTGTHDARRQVAPLVLLSNHPSCALSRCVHAHTCTLGTNAYMNTRTRTRTCTHDAGRQVAPLVLLSIHPSYHRTEHMCTRTHAHIDTDSEDRGGSDAGKCNEEYRDRGNRAVQTLVTEENATETTAAETISGARGTHARTHARMDCLL